MSPRILMNRWVSRGQAQIVHDGTTRSSYLRRGGMTKSRTVDGGAARLLIVVALGGLLHSKGTHVLGAQAGPRQLEEVLRSAGLGSVRRAAQTPFNIIIEARR
jgi:hypothetical protein